MDYIISIFIAFLTCFTDFIYAFHVCNNLQIEFTLEDCNYRCDISNDTLIYCLDEKPVHCDPKESKCPSQAVCEIQQCLLIAADNCSNIKPPTIKIPYCRVIKPNISTTVPPRITTRKSDHGLRPVKGSSQNAYNGRSYAETYQPYIFSMVLALIPLVMYLVYRVGRYAMMLQIEASEAVEPPNFNPRRPPSRLNSLPRSPNRSLNRSPVRSPQRSPNRSPQRSTSSRISNSSGTRSPQPPNSLSPHRLSPRPHSQQRSHSQGYPIGLDTQPVLLVVPSRRDSPEVPPDLPPPYSAVEPNLESPPTYIEAMQNLEKSKPTVEV